MIMSNEYILRSVLCHLRGVTEDLLSPLETMICGGVAGVCFWSAIFPLDVIKSRIQVRGVQGNVLTGDEGDQGELEGGRNWL